MLQLTKDEIIELLEMKVGPSLKIFDLIQQLKCKIKQPQSRHSFKQSFESEPRCYEYQLICKVVELSLDFSIIATRRHSNGGNGGLVGYKKLNVRNFLEMYVRPKQILFMTDINFIRNSLILFSYVIPVLCGGNQLFWFSGYCNRIIDTLATQPHDFSLYHNYEQKHVPKISIIALISVTVQVLFVCV